MGSGGGVPPWISRGVMRGGGVGLGLWPFQERKGVGRREAAAHVRAGDDGVVAMRPEEEHKGGGARALVREREGGGLGRAGREAKAQEEWREMANRTPRLRWLGRKPELGPIQEIKPFQILFEIYIFGQLWKFVHGDLEGILT
jgi:hypothetical protein